MAAIKSSEQDEDQLQQTPNFSDLDKGWAWVVLLASFGSFLIIGGSVYGVGIIHIALLERYKQDVTTTAWVGALHSALMNLGGPLATIVIDKFSCRTALVVSGFLYVCGYLATAFAPSIEICVFTCGIVAGCGSATGYTAAMVVIGFNFHQKRNLAMGLAVCGMGAGLFVMVPLFEAAREFYGNSGFFIALAGLTANITVLGTLCFPSKLELYTQNKRKNEMLLKTRDGRSRVWSVMRFYLHVAFQKPVLCLCFCMLSYCLATHLIFLHLPKYAIQEGSTSTQASLLLSICGIMGLFGRLMTGLSTNHHTIDEILLYSGTMGVVSLVTLLFPLYSNSFLGQAAYSAIYGLYFGCCYVVTGSVNIRFVGMKCMAAAIGLEFFYGGIGSVIGPVLAGIIVDNNGTYEQSFLVAGFFSLLGCIFAIATVISAPITEKESDTSNKEKNGCDNNGYEMDNENLP